MPPAETWRFVLDTGETVDVYPVDRGDDDEGDWIASAYGIGTGASRSTARAAVYALASSDGDRVVEVLAPGQVPRAEAVAEIDRLRAALTPDFLAAMIAARAETDHAEVTRLRAIEAAARAAIAAEDAARDLVGEDGFDAANAARRLARATLAGLLAGEVTDAGKAAGA